MDGNVESKGDTFRLLHTPTHILAGLLSSSAQDKLGICNIDAFLLLLLLFYPSLAAARFCDKKVNSVI